MNWEMVANYMPTYIKGAIVSLEISVLAMIGATLLGYVIALMRLSSSKPLRSFAAIYVWILRGTPLMLILFWMYYATPFHLKLSSFSAGLIAMILNSSSFKSEIIRSGLMAVDKKQLEAADAIGMTPIQKMIRITIPQAVRIVIPPYINNCVIMLKESAQVSIITVQDLMLVVQRTYSSTYQVAETLGICALIYLTMTSATMLLQYIAERKLSTPRRQG